MKNLRPSIVRLFEQGQRKSEIARLLKINEATVRKAIKRFQETGRNDDRPRSGHLLTANTAINRLTNARIVGHQLSVLLRNFIVGLLFEQFYMYMK